MAPTSNTNTTQPSTESIRYRTPRGERQVSLDRHRRLTAVAELLQMGADSTKIQTAIADQFSVSKETIRDDIDLLYAHWQTEDRKLLPVKRRILDQNAAMLFRMAVGHKRAVTLRDAEGNQRVEYVPDPQLSVATRLLEFQRRLYGIGEGDSANLIPEVSNMIEDALSDSDIEATTERVLRRLERNKRMRSRARLTEGEVIDVETVAQGL